MNNKTFTPIEETISFYTRNDFAIMNHLLVGNFDNIWNYAMTAYNDNRAIIKEYETGVRSIDSDYDIKWLNALKKRLVNELDDEAKATILKNAREDIANIMNAMTPAKDDMLLYRTAWIDSKMIKENEYAYSREYKTLSLSFDSVFEVKTISSCSLTPYRENDDVGSDFYRYEIHVPSGLPVLELDQFVTHNEDGEVLLPPMRCRVISVRDSQNPKCRGIIDVEYISSLQQKYGE